MTPERIAAALRKATDALLAELNPQGYWEGELSSSALSTATAVVALCQVDTLAYADFIAQGLRWLAGHANAHGGWGDTVLSKSNISTTALCWAAFGAAGADSEFPNAVPRAAAWLERASGAASIPVAVAARYGKERPFSLPDLVTPAPSGRHRSGGGLP